MTYYKKVYTASYMILRNHALAEEIAQETFMIACEKIDTLREPAKFPSWVTSIAVHKSINLSERNKKIIPIDDEAILDYFERKNTNQTDLAETAVKNELISEVKEAIDHLKPEMKEIIIYRYYLDLSYEEIGECLDRPVGTVKSAMHRARKLLAKALTSGQPKVSQNRGERIGRAK